MGFRKLAFLVLSFSFLFCAMPCRAQLGNAGSIEGVVKDASGGVVVGAKVEISYSVTGYQRETTTGSGRIFPVAALKSTATRLRSAWPKRSVRR